MRHPHPLLSWIVGVSLAVTALLVAARMSQSYGLLGAVAGFLLFWLVVLACLFALFGLVFVVEFFRRRGPQYPPCHNGTCKGRRWPSLGDWHLGDYERVWLGDDSVLRCKCGRDYVTRNAGQRFMERLPDGTLKPYMMHKDYRGWVADRDENGAENDRAD